MQSKSINDLYPLLTRLRLKGMIPCLQDQIADPASSERAFLNRLYDLLDSEIRRRDENALQKRIKEAHLKMPQACPSEIDFTLPRGLNKGQIQTLTACDWIRAHQNVIITGPTGVGKTFIANALCNAALQQNFKCKVVRVPRLLKKMLSAHDLVNGFEKELRDMRKYSLVVLDDWGLGEMSAVGRSDFLELIDERSGNCSFIFTSMLPVDKWAEWIDDPSYSDPILDRVTLNAHRIKMKGESLRRLPQYGAIDKICAKEE